MTVLRRIIPVYRIHSAIIHDIYLLQAVCSPLSSSSSSTYWRISPGWHSGLCKLHLRWKSRTAFFAVIFQNRQIGQCNIHLRPAPSVLPFLAIITSRLIIMDIFTSYIVRVIFQSYKPQPGSNTWLSTFAEQPRNHKNQDDDHHRGCQIKEQSAGRNEGNQKAVGPPSGSGSSHWPGQNSHFSRTVRKNPAQLIQDQFGQYPEIPNIIIIWT